MYHNTLTALRGINVQSLDVNDKRNLIIAYLKDTLRSDDLIEINNTLTIRNLTALIMILSKRYPVMTDPTTLSFKAVLDQRLIVNTLWMRYRDMINYIDRNASSFDGGEAA